MPLNKVYSIKSIDRVAAELGETVIGSSTSPLILKPKMACSGSTVPATTASSHPHR